METANDDGEIKSHITAGRSQSIKTPGSREYDSVYDQRSRRVNS
jgi:hypothetical protein